MRTRFQPVLLLLFYRDPRRVWVMECVFFERKSAGWALLEGFFYMGNPLRDSTSCASEVIGSSHRLRVQPLAV